MPMGKKKMARNMAQQPYESSKYPTCRHERRVKRECHRHRDTIAEHSIHNRQTGIWMFWQQYMFTWRSSLTRHDGHPPPLCTTVTDDGTAVGWTYTWVGGG